MGTALNGKALRKGVTQRPDKKYQARFTKKNGKRTAKLFDTLGAAYEWLDRQKKEDECKGAEYQPKHVTLDDLFHMWMDTSVRPRLKYNSIKLYEGRYVYRVQPVIGTMFIEDIKPYHIQETLNEAAARGDANESLSKIRFILHQIFDFAVDNGIAYYNPVTKNIKFSGKERKEKVVLTVPEQKRFVETVAGTTYGDQFLFLLNTGLRYGELAGLKWEDVDFKKSSIHIRRTMYYNTDETHYDIHEPKTASGKRTIPLTPEAENILKRRKERQKISSLEYPGFVFTSKYGRPIHPSKLNQALDKISERENLPHLSLHALRHTFATRCVEDGMKPNVLQKILGHKNLSMTMDLYVHVTEEEKQTEMKKLKNHSKVS